MALGHAERQANYEARQKKRQEQKEERAKAEKLAQKHMHFEDSTHIEAPLIKRFPSPPDIRRSTCGNAALQCVQKSGWMLTRDQAAEKEREPESESI